MKKIMTVVLGLALAGSLFADSAYSFTYQAALRDEHGLVISNNLQIVRNHTVTLRLWTEPSGGVLLWGRVFNVYTDATGLFNLEVSDEGGALSGETPLYPTLEETFCAKPAGGVYVGLEVKNSAGEIVPRQRLFAVPFAAVANDVRKISQDVTVGGNITMGSGTVRVTASGITQTTGSSTFQDLAVNGKVAAGGVITANAGLTVNGGTLKVNTDLAIASGKKLTVDGAEIIPVPVGGIIMWTKSSLPDSEHWAICDGSTHNGITTPNLRDRFVVGAGSSYSAGATGGANEVTLTVDQMPAHKHTYTFNGADLAANWDNDNYFYNINNRYNNPNTRETSSAGGGKAHENRPPYYALYYIMRVK